MIDKGKQRGITREPSLPDFYKVEYCNGYAVFSRKPSDWIVKELVKYLDLAYNKGKQDYRYNIKCFLKEILD